MIFEKGEEPVQGPFVRMTNHFDIAVKLLKPITK